MTFDDYGMPQEAPKGNQTQDRVAFALEEAAKLRSQRDVSATVGTQDASKQLSYQAQVSAYTKWHDPKRSIENLTEAANRREARKEYLDSFMAQGEVVHKRDLADFESNLDAMNYAYNAKALLKQVSGSSAIKSGAIHGLLNFFEAGKGLANRADSAFNVKMKYLGMDGAEHDYDRSPKTVGDAILEAEKMIAHLDGADLGSLVSPEERKKVTEFKTALGLVGGVRGVGELMGVGAGMRYASKGLGAISKHLRGAGAMGKAIDLETKAVAAEAAAAKQGAAAGAAKAAEEARKAADAAFQGGANATKAPHTFLSGIARGGEVATGALGGKYGGKVGHTYGTFVGHGAVGGTIRASDDYTQGLLNNKNNTRQKGESDQDYIDRIQGTLLGRSWHMFKGGVKGGLEGIIPATGFALSGGIASKIGRAWAPNRLPPKMKAFGEALDLQKGSLGIRIRQATARYPFVNQFIHNYTEFVGGEHISEVLSEMLLGHEPTIFKKTDDPLLNNVYLPLLFATAFSTKGAWDRARARRAAKLPAGIAETDAGHYKDVREFTDAVNVPGLKESIDKVISEGFPVGDMAALGRAAKEGGNQLQTALQEVTAQLIEWRKNNPAGSAPQGGPQPAGGGPAPAGGGGVGQPVGAAAVDKTNRFYERVNKAMGGQVDRATFDKLMNEAQGVHDEAAKLGDAATVTAGKKLQELFHKEGNLTASEQSALREALDTFNRGMQPEAESARARATLKLENVAELRTELKKLTTEFKVAGATLVGDARKTRRQELVDQMAAIEQQIKDITTPPKAGAAAGKPVVTKPGAKPGVSPAAAKPAPAATPAAGQPAAGTTPAKGGAAAVKAAQPASPHMEAADAALAEHTGKPHKGAIEALARAMEQYNVTPEKVFQEISFRSFDTEGKNFEELRGDEIKKYINEIYPSAEKVRLSTAEGVVPGGRGAEPAAPAEPTAPPPEATKPAEAAKPPAPAPAGKIKKAENIGDVLELLPETWEGEGETYTRAEFESYDQAKQRRALVEARNVRDSEVIEARALERGADKGQYKSFQSARVRAEERFDALKKAIERDKHLISREGLSTKEKATKAATAPKPAAPEAKTPREVEDEALGEKITAAAEKLKGELRAQPIKPFPKSLTDAVRAATDRIFPQAERVEMRDLQEKTRTGQLTRAERARLAELRAKDEAATKAAGQIHRGETAEEAKPTAEEFAAAVEKVRAEPEPEAAPAADKEPMSWEEQAASSANAQREAQAWKDLNEAEHQVKVWEDKLIDLKASRPRFFGKAKHEFKIQDAWATLSRWRDKAEAAGKEVTAAREAREAGVEPFKFEISPEEVETGEASTALEDMPKPAAEAVPEWLKENIAGLTTEADTIGATAEIIDLAKQKKTAKTIVLALKGKHPTISMDMVRAVRSKHGIAAADEAAEPAPTPAEAARKAATPPEKKAEEPESIEAELTRLEKEFDQVEKALKAQHDDDLGGLTKRLDLKSRRDRIRARHEYLLKQLPPEAEVPAATPEPEAPAPTAEPRPIPTDKAALEKRKNEISNYSFELSNKGMELPAEVEREFDEINRRLKELAATPAEAAKKAATPPEKKKSDFGERMKAARAAKAAAKASQDKVIEAREKVEAATTEAEKEKANAALNVEVFKAAGVEPRAADVEAAKPVVKEAKKTPTTGGVNQRGIDLIKGQQEAHVLKELGIGDISPEARAALRTLADARTKPMDYEGRVRNVLKKHSQGTPAELEASMISEASIPKEAPEPVTPAEAARKAATPPEKAGGGAGGDVEAKRTAMWKVVNEFEESPSKKAQPAYEAAKKWLRENPKPSAAKPVPEKAKETQSSKEWYLSQARESERIAKETINPQTKKDFEQKAREMRKLASEEGEPTLTGEAFKKHQAEAKRKAAEPEEETPITPEQEAASKAFAAKKEAQKPKTTAQKEAALIEFMRKAGHTLRPEDARAALDLAGGNLSEAQKVAMDLTTGEGMEAEPAPEVLTPKEKARKAATPPKGRAEKKGTPTKDTLASASEARKKALSKWKQYYAENPVAKEAQDAGKAYTESLTKEAEILAERARGEKGTGEGVAFKPEPETRAVWSQAYKTEKGEILVGRKDPTHKAWSVLKFRSEADFPDKGVPAYGFALDRAGIEKVIKHNHPKVSGYSIPKEFRGTEVFEEPPRPAEQLPSEGISPEFVSDTIIAGEAKAMLVGGTFKGKKYKGGNYPEAVARAQDMMPGPEKIAILNYLRDYEAAAQSVRRASVKKKGVIPKPTPEQIANAREVLRRKDLPHLWAGSPPPELTLSVKEQEQILGNRSLYEIEGNPLAGGLEERLTGEDARYEAVKAYSPTLDWGGIHGEASGSQALFDGWPPVRQRGDTGELERARERSYNIEFRDTSIARARKKELQQARITDEIKADADAGIFTGKTPESAASSLYRLLTSLKAQGKKQSPGQVFRIVSTVHTPLFPGSWLAKYSRDNPLAHESTRDRMVASAVLREALEIDPIKHAELWLTPEAFATFKRIEASGETLAKQAHREFLTKEFNEAYVKEAVAFLDAVKAQKLDREVTPGALMGTPFEGLAEKMNQVLQWMKASQARDFNLFEVMWDNGKTPREAVIDMLYTERFLTKEQLEGKPLEKALMRFAAVEAGEFGEGTQKGTEYTMARLMQPEWFEHLFRAYEVMNGIGTEKVIQQRAALSAQLDYTRKRESRMKTLAEYRMSEKEAALIAKAWESGDPEKIQKHLELKKTVGNEATEAMDLKSIVDRESKFESEFPKEYVIAEDFSFSPDALKDAQEIPNMVWHTHPMSPKFIKLVREVEAKVPDVIKNIDHMESQAYSAHSPKDWLEMVEDLQRLPRYAINAAEMLHEAKMQYLKGDKKLALKLYEQAEISMAIGFEEAAFKGHTELEVIEQLLNNDTQQMNVELRMRAGQLGRSYSAKLMSEMRARKWLVDSPDGLKMGSRMMVLMRQVGKAKGRAHENKFTKNRDLNFGEGWGDPLRWICFSDCMVPMQKMKEWKDELPEKFKSAGTRLMNIWSRERTSIQDALSLWGRQVADPEAKKFNNSMINKMTATNRNRFGDVISTALGKYNIEKDTMTMNMIARYQNILASHGFKELQPILHERPVWDELTELQKAESIELQQLLRVLDGNPGANPDFLSERARAAMPELREYLVDSKRFLADHIFRHLKFAAEQALRDGTEVPAGMLRRWQRMFGEMDDPAQIRDPQQILDILKHTIEADPNAPAIELHGRWVRGWGLKSYYPHIWRGHKGVGDAFTHADDPGTASGAELGERAPWLNNREIEAWKKEYVEDYARKHGFLGNTKRMANIFERLKDKDGYIEDLHWTLRDYTQRMNDKVYYERLMDDLQPLMFGEWQNVETHDPNILRSWIEMVPTEAKDDHHAALGGVDHKFGVRLIGNLKRVGYRLNTRSGPVKPEKGVIGKEQRRLFEKGWKRDLWRVKSYNFDNWNHEDPKMQRKVNVQLSNGKETIILWGKKGIEIAGMQVQKGGMVNYRSGEQYAALKDLVRRAIGYDIEKGTYAGKEDEQSSIGKMVKTVADMTSDFIYHSQLGGYINTKAGMVQMLEGLIQNFSAVGVGPMKDFGPHMKGAIRFNHYVLLSKDPVQARIRAKELFKGDPYVDKVLPVFEAAGMLPDHLLQTHGTEKPGLIDWAKRASFASFSLADVFTKEMSYYAAYQRIVEVGEWKDPVTGRVLRVTPDYIPVGQMYKRYRDVISAHDVARMVMERTHFTLPRWAQPGFVRKIPGWSFFGHLGTQASNITAEFWYGMGSAMKYMKTGDDVHLFQARKAGQYMAALAGAMVIAQILQRNIGQYVGQHPKDMGAGPFKMGKYFPFLNWLPDQVRMPAWQPPNELSLPARMWGSPDPEEGVIAMTGNAMMRMMSGEQEPGDAMKSAFRNWWNKQSRTILGRQVKPLVNALTATHSDLDPDRPWEVRDPWWFGPEGKTRYRSDFDLYFGDIFLPGWSARDSAEQQRTEWAKELSGVRQSIGRELHKMLRSSNPDEVAWAREELRRRGFKVEEWRIRKAAIMDRLPSYIRRAIGGGDRVTKLTNFAELAEHWEPNFRKLALKWILPENRRPDLRSLPAGLWDDVLTAASAPWED